MIVASIPATPVRLQLSRRAGFNLQALSLATNGLVAVNVARPGKWGNPFVAGKPSGCDFKDDGDITPMIAALSHGQAIEFFRDMTWGFLSPEMHPHGHNHMTRWRRQVTGMSISEAARIYLRGKNLACFCRLDQPCHADTLLHLANFTCEDAP